MRDKHRGSKIRPGPTWAWVTAIAALTSCATTEPQLGATAAALEGVEGTMDVAIDAPWRIEPVTERVGTSEVQTYGEIPITVTIGDGNVVGADPALPPRGGSGSQADPELLPGNSIGRFCELVVHDRGVAHRYDFGDMAEVEATFGAWPDPDHASPMPPRNRICRFWNGESPEACDELRSLDGTSEWHALAWYPVDTREHRPGDDVPLVLDLRLSRRTDVDCASTDPADFVTYQNVVRVHLGEAPLPRFTSASGDWVYGDVHYHSQGTDNEGESGYAHRNVVHALGAMGVDFVLASEHASDSTQYTDIDIEESLTTIDWSVYIDLEGRYHGPVLRDMSAQRFQTLYRRIYGMGGVNTEAAWLSGHSGSLPQGARTHGIVPQLFLGGEVDVIPEAGPEEQESIRYGLDGRYPLLELCHWLPDSVESLDIPLDLSIAPSHCDLAAINGDRLPDQTVLIHDAQGTGDTRFYGRHHILYMPPGVDPDAFVSSGTSLYGGATRRLPDVLDDVRSHGGSIFIAHPHSMGASIGPDGTPWSEHDFDMAFADAAVLGLEFWNEDIYLETDFNDEDAADQRWGFDRTLSGGIDVTTGTEVLDDPFDGWVSGRFGFDPWTNVFAPCPGCAQWGRRSHSTTNMLQRGEVAWDELNLRGLRADQAPSWVAPGDARRMLIAGGSDAHGDWNYRREGYALGIQGVTTAAIARPRNLVFVPRSRPPHAVVDDPTQPAARAIDQSAVLEALRSGNFSTTNGPAVRIVVDENRNGVIDESDRPMGGTTHLYGDTRLPILVEWMSTPEFGAVEGIELTVGVLDVERGTGRVYRGGDGPVGERAYEGDTRYLGRDIWLHGELGVHFDETEDAASRMTGVQPFEIDLGRLRTDEYLSIADSVYVRAFVRTRRADPSCTGFQQPCYRTERALRRFAYTNPVWLMHRDPAMCTTDDAALDGDGDGIPDACDPCDGSDSACSDGLPPDTGTVGTTWVTCFLDTDGDGFSEAGMTPVRLGARPGLNCPAGYTLLPPTSATTTDCAPSDPFIHPGASEWCDPGLTDHDCDPTNEGAIGCYLDADADGFGSGPPLLMCALGELGVCPNGYSDNALDCCDSDPRAFPGQPAFSTSARACGGFDFDCSASVTSQYGTATACAGRSSATCASAAAGFTSSLICGYSASFQTGCVWNATRRSCVPASSTTRTVACR